MDDLRQPDESPILLAESNRICATRVDQHVSKCDLSQPHTLINHLEQTTTESSEKQQSQQLSAYKWTRPAQLQFVGLSEEHSRDNSIESMSRRVNTSSGSPGGFMNRLVDSQQNYSVSPAGEQLTTEAIERRRTNRIDILTNQIPHFNQEKMVATIEGEVLGLTSEVKRLFAINESLASEVHSWRGKFEQCQAQKVLVDQKLHMIQAELEKKNKLTSPTEATCMYLHDESHIDATSFDQRKSDKFKMKTEFTDDLNRSQEQFNSVSSLAHCADPMQPSSQAVLLLSQNSVFAPSLKPTDKHALSSSNQNLSSIDQLKLKCTSLEQQLIQQTRLVAQLLSQLTEKQQQIYKLQAVALEADQKTTSTKTENYSSSITNSKIPAYFDCSQIFYHQQSPQINQRKRSTSSDQSPIIDTIISPQTSQPHCYSIVTPIKQKHCNDSVSSTIQPINYGNNQIKSAQKIILHSVLSDQQRSTSNSKNVTQINPNNSNLLKTQLSSDQHPNNDKPQTSEIATPLRREAESTSKHSPIPNSVFISQCESITYITQNPRQPKELKNPKESEQSYIVVDNSPILNPSLLSSNLNGRQWSILNNVNTPNKSNPIIPDQLFESTFNPPVSNNSSYTSIHYQPRLSISNPMDEKISHERQS